MFRKLSYKALREKCEELQQELEESQRKLEESEKLHNHFKRKYEDKEKELVDQNTLWSKQKRKAIEEYRENNIFLSNENLKLIEANKKANDVWKDERKGLKIAYMKLKSDRDFYRKTFGKLKRSQKLEVKKNFNMRVNNMPYPKNFFEQSDMQTSLCYDEEIWLSHGYDRLEARRYMNQMKPLPKKEPDFFDFDEEIDIPFGD